MLSLTKGSKVNFRLVKSVNSDKPIMLDYSYGRDLRFRINLGISVDEKYWNLNKQRVKRISNNPNWLKINQLLNSLESELIEFVLKSVADGEVITSELLKEFVNGIINKKPTQMAPKNNVLVEWDNYLRSMSKTSTKDVNGTNTGTLKSYRQAFKHFNNFYSKTGISTSFDSVDIKFYNLFVDYMTSILKPDGEPYNYRTINKHLKSFKTFMGYCLKHDITANVKFKHFDKLPEIDATEIYLTLEEQRKMFELDLSDKPGHQLARDIFIIGCQIGQRIGDYQDLSLWERVKKNGEDYLIKKQQKTKNNVTCPLPNKVTDMLELRYKGGLPPKMSPQKLNEYIKEVAAFAGIDQEIKVDKAQGGKIVEVYQPKYELVKGHTARRSFCTNKYILGVPVHEIMKISGHKTEREFMKYIKSDDLAKVVEINKTQAYQSSNI